MFKMQFFNLNLLTPINLNPKIKDKSYEKQKISPSAPPPS